MLKHGKNTRKKRHPVYNVWLNMKQRCVNPKHPDYHNYGGRGIAVCAEWDAFEQFYEDIGNRPSADYSIERLDNNKGYSQDNCIWAHYTQQHANRRNTVSATVDGITKTAIEWAKDAEASYTTICRRLRMGISDKEAVFAPPRGRVAKS